MVDCNRAFSLVPDHSISAYPVDKLHGQVTRSPALIMQLHITYRVRKCYWKPNLTAVIEWRPTGCMGLDNWNPSRTRMRP